MTKQNRIDKALRFAIKYGGIDGAHHKTWVIDQIIRALTGCPTVTRRARDYQNKPYTYRCQGESKEYKDLVKRAKAGEDGPDTYEWDEGIPP